MLAFPGMLIEAARRAGMKTPTFEELNDYGLKSRFNGEPCDKEKFPHFWMFCVLQLGRRMELPNEHWENAKVIAAIPLDKLTTMTARDFAEAGVIGL